MKGFTIEYSTDSNLNKVKLHHVLFGRVVYKAYRGRQTAYYFPGMLDKTPFVRLINSKIFVPTLSACDIDRLNDFGELNIIPGERDISTTKMYTSREHWTLVAKERGYNIKICKKVK